MAEYPVRVSLDIFGGMEGDSQQEASSRAVEVITGALRDSGWSPVMPGSTEIFPVEIDGKMKILDFPIPVMVDYVIFTSKCQWESPGGFNCSLDAGHITSGSPHVAMGDRRVLAIWR